MPCSILVLLDSLASCILSFDASKAAENAPHMYVLHAYTCSSIIISKSLKLGYLRNRTIAQDSHFAPASAKLKYSIIIVFTGETPGRKCLQSKKVYRQPLCIWEHYINIAHKSVREKKNRQYSSQMNRYTRRNVKNFLQRRRPSQASGSDSLHFRCDS